MNEVLDGLKDFGKARTWKSVGMAALGASGHAVYPTLIEAVFKTDLSGYKGLFTGIGLNTITGILLRSPEYILGGFSAAALHFWYGRLNGWVVYPVLNQYLFRFNPVSENSALSGVPSQSQLQDGAKWVEIGGRKVQIFDRNDVTAEATAPAPIPAKEQTTPALQGFQQALPAAPISQNPPSSLAGFRTNVAKLNGFGQAGMSLMERSKGANKRSALETPALG